MILPFGIINRNNVFFIFFVCNYLKKLLQQDRCRWENLYRGQYLFKPIKFLNLFVSSPFEHKLGYN